MRRGLTAVEEYHVGGSTRDIRRSMREREMYEVDHLLSNCTSDLHFDIKLHYHLPFLTITPPFPILSLRKHSIQFWHKDRQETAHLLDTLTRNCTTFRQIDIELHGTRELSILFSAQVKRIEQVQSPLDDHRPRKQKRRDGWPKNQERCNSTEKKTHKEPS